jgi:membrane peptidoglycan carboxypeptidase
MAMATIPGGTAQAAHLAGTDFAGKTGTAQLVSHSTMNVTTGQFRADAWFVGIAPRRNPGIAVVVLWQNGADGPFSALIAARVIAAYVNKKRREDNNLVPSVEQDRTMPTTIAENHLLNSNDRMSQIVTSRLSTKSNRPANAYITIRAFRSGECDAASTTG